MERALQDKISMESSTLIIQKSSRSLIVISILVIISVISTSGLIYYYLQVVNIQKTNSTQSKISDLTVDKVQETEETDSTKLTGSFYVGPKAFHLEYITIPKSSSTTVPEIGKYVLVSTYPSLEQYVLLEERYTGCDIPKITFQSFGVYKEFLNITRFLVEYACGDSVSRIVLGIATNSSDSKLVVLPALTVEPIDTYLTLYYKTVGWLSPEEIIMNEVRYDRSTGNETASRLVKIDVTAPKKIIPLQ